jgi:hypothetical protein
MNQVKLLNWYKFGITFLIISILNVYSKVEGILRDAALNMTTYNLSMYVYCTIEPPSILEHSGDQTVREGDTVALWCKVGGEPYPAVTWYRQYVHEKNSAKSSMFYDNMFI